MGSMEKNEIAFSRQGLFIDGGFFADYLSEFYYENKWRGCSLRDIILHY